MQISVCVRTCAPCTRARSLQIATAMKPVELVKKGSVAADGELRRLGKGHSHTHTLPHAHTQTCTHADKHTDVHTLVEICSVGTVGAPTDAIFQIFLCSPRFFIAAA